LDPDPVPVCCKNPMLNKAKLQKLYEKEEKMVVKAFFIEV
jgi:hypothetical protein